MGGVIYNEIKVDSYQGGRSQDLVEGKFGEARRNEWEAYKSTGVVTPGYVGDGVVVSNGTINFDENGNITNMDELTFEPNTKPVTLQSYVAHLSYVSNFGEAFSEAWMMSRTYAKLREVVIGYSFPTELLSRTFIKRANISLVGRNLLYFASRKDIDLDQYPGYNIYPPLQSATTRRYGININLTF